jgi:hypothetical protein
MGAAYRASGRTTPIMDGLAIHPYGEASNVAPDLAHPKSTSIGLADYSKLVTLLGQAFDGTAQPGSSLPILYDEYGVESEIPDTKVSLYTGNEPTTTHPVDETTQDETARLSWQSGVYYADGTPKASFWSVLSDMARARGGSIAHCDGMALDVTPTALRFPKAAVLPTGKAAIRVACPLDCVATLSLTRSDGTVVWTRNAYVLADTPYDLRLGKLRLAAGTYAFSASVVHPVNPGTPFVLQGGTFVVR